MTHTHTDWKCLALAAVTAVAALQLCASIPRRAQNASGAVTDQYCYGPYGTDWGRTGTNAIPFRWLGSHGVLAAEALSPITSYLLPLTSSLYLTRHRAYDAALGRFLSADPLGLGGGPNLYAYCIGNPLAYIDPLGLALSAAGIGMDRAFDRAWNFGVQFVTYNPDASPQVLDGMYQVSLSTFGSPMQRLFGVYDTPSSQPVTVAPELVSSAWAAGAVGVALRNVGAKPPAPSIAANNNTALSPYRYTTPGETFQHYSSVQHAESLATGLRPGSYSTTARGLSGVEAQQGLALPQVNPPNAVYTISPPAGTPIRVNPITRPQFGQPGGLPEVEFIFGTPPGSVSGPTLIPRGAP